jgi:hypothetical protein
MKTCLVGLFLFASVLVYAQDEGSVVRVDRINLNKGLFIGIGPSFTFGKNIGDYSTGFNFEAGFLKRVNRVLSIGPSISFISFKYDPEKTTADDGGAYYGTGNIDTDWYGSAYDTWNNKYGLSESYDYAYVLTLEGGDVSLISLALNLKLNFVPIKDNSVFSLYFFAKPFITSAKRKDVTGTGTLYVYEAYEDRNGTISNEFDDILYYNLGDNTWYPDGYEEDWGPESFEALKSENSITGGIFIGPGIEFIPAKRVSPFLQFTIGYTFPLSFVSTKSYDNSINSYVDDEFPIVKKGFTSLNVQVGIAINF